MPGVRQLMVLTILEARVETDKQAIMERTYRARTHPLPPSIIETRLTRSSSDASVWRINTLWRPREALDEMRRSPEVPVGVQIFRAAAAEPLLSVWDVIDQSAGT
jgi:hypothetical protein